MSDRLPAWSITKDHLADADSPDRAGVKSRTTVPATTQFTAFRLYDDDGELYYEGVIAETWLYHGNEHLAFAPLDWGLADAGCTRMDYKDPDGNWRTL